MINFRDSGSAVSTLVDVTRAAARQWGSGVAWEFPACGQTLTFTEVDGRSTAIANRLAQVGVRPGDRVAVMLPNVPEYPLTWLALAKLGAVLVPINSRYQQADARHVLRHSGAVAVVTCADHESLLRAVRPDLPDLRWLLSIDGVESDGTDLTPWFEGDETPIEPAPVAEQLLNIEYTSGTTGMPKGCMLTHHYWLTLARSLVDEFPWVTSEDVLLTAQPFSYLDPQWNVVVALLAGARLVVLDGFHPSSFWEMVRHHRVTLFYCIGLMPQVLLRMPPRPDDRENRVRAVLCSAISPAVHQALEERWGAPWYEAFGMTESGADIAMTDADHAELVGSGCLGRPRAHREARVVDADGDVLPRGQVGELVLRGTGMMDGYYKDPEATAQTFRSGWLHTGDLARMDAEGRLYHAGRKKDMIRRSGENIAAVEVEEVLARHPAVKMCGVVGVADELRGEEVKAYVVLDPGAESAVTMADLREFCAKQLAPFKIPRYWALRERLPMTPSERVAKAELRSDDGLFVDLAPGRGSGA